jgi:outer membrane murein-binding lipoprotein Lpp
MLKRIAFIGAVLLAGCSDRVSEAEKQRSAEIHQLRQSIEQLKSDVYKLRQDVDDNRKFTEAVSNDVRAVQKQVARNASVSSKNAVRQHATRRAVCAREWHQSPNGVSGWVNIPCE